MRRPSASMCCPLALRRDAAASRQRHNDDQAGDVHSGSSAAGPEFLSALPGGALIWISIGSLAEEGGKINGAVPIQNLNRSSAAARS